MYTLVRNLLLVASLVVVAVVLVRAAKHGDGPEVPEAAIKGAGKPEAGSKEDKDPPPRVLHVNPTTEEHGAVSPVGPLEGSSYDKLAPTGSFQISPVPSPATRSETVPVEKTPVPAYQGAYPLPSAVDPNEIPTPSDDQQLAAAPVDSEYAPAEAVIPIEADPPQQVNSPITTGQGDSFESISEKAYGSSNYGKALFRHNQNEVLRADQLRPGTKIKIPPLATLRALYPEDIPADSHDE